MKKSSLNRMIGLPLVAAALSCAAADLYAAPTSAPYGGYKNYGNYQPYSGDSGYGATMSPYLPTSQGSVQNSNRAASPNYSGPAYYTSGSNAANSNLNRSANYYSNQPSSNINSGMSMMNPQSYSNINSGMCQGAGPSSCGAITQGQGASCNPAVGCPSGYRTGFSQSYFNSPEIPINSNANYAIYGNMDSLNPALSKCLNQPCGSGSATQANYAPQNWSTGNPVQPGCPAQNWNANAYQQNQSWNANQPNQSWNASQQNQNWNQGR